MAAGPQVCGIVLTARAHPSQPGDDSFGEVFQICLFRKRGDKRQAPPDLFLHAAARMGVQPIDCIVVEDSAAGVTAATAAGMTAIGFVGASHAGFQLGEELKSAGARIIVADLRHLKGAVVALRGW